MTVTVPHEGTVLSVGDLEAIASELLRRVGMSHVNACRMAAVLVFAQASGIDSHGLMHLPAYVSGMVHGSVEPRPEFKLLSVRPGAVTIDGDNGPGVLCALEATDKAIQCAAKTGVGAVSVRNSGHFGVASAFVDRMVARGMIGLVFSNASPTVAPRGGSVAAFGTNPIAAGFPRKNGPPVIIDLATTNGSRARIRKAAQSGESIPDNWALDEKGSPTTDPAAALGGTMQALGGVKGTSLGLMVDLLCVALSGGTIGPDVKAPQQSRDEKPGVSHLFVAFDTEAFGSVEQISSKIEEAATALETSTPIDPDHPVRMPGARAAVCREKSRSSGILITSALSQALHKAADIVAEAESTQYHPMRA